MAKTVITARTVVVSDPLARANVVAVLAGPGAPAGVVGCVERAGTVVVEFDEDRTAGDLVDALAATAAAFVPARAAAIADISAAAATAALGLNEPALDASRVIETYLP